MAMSDRRILEAAARGDIIIDPFHPDQLQTSSYDVCIGENFYREHRVGFAAGIYNIYDPVHVQRVWGKPQLAESAAEVFRDAPNHYGFAPEDKVILLAPGETILAHTEEFIGGRGIYTTMMKARSSMGRSFILVCKCAGWGDVGYINRWTMEITNVSKEWAIPMPVGERVAQIIFMEAGPVLDQEYGVTGNYQSSTDIEEVKTQWQPQNMLPKLKRKQLGSPVALQQYALDRLSNLTMTYRVE